MKQTIKGVLRRIPARARLDPRERQRRRAVLQHTRGLRRPTANGVVVPEKAPTPEDAEIAARLLSAYQAASEPTGGARTDLWTAIEERQRDFVALLARGDVEELGRYLCNVSRHDASIGITQGPDEFRRIRSDNAYRDYVALLAKDKLVALAEAIGALPVENHEQGPLRYNLYRDAAELVDRIGVRLGIDVTPPDVDGGLLKLDTGRGLFGERDANAIYTAWLLTRFLAGRDGARVCEIGGGSGRVAYWSRRLGLASYTIVDLPRVNVVQGYYALKTLPADGVALYGEQPAARDGVLSILPAQAISEIADRPFDLVLNQDSFPEIDPETVADYLRWIRASGAGRFVSINHENKPPGVDGAVQLSVPEIIGAVGGFALEHRWPYWLRSGYVLETYFVDSVRSTT